MTEQEVFQELDKIFKQVFARDDFELTPSLSPAELEDWDSYRQIDIFLAAEKRFGFKAGVREIAAASKVQHIADIILRHLRSK